MTSLVGIKSQRTRDSFALFPFGLIDVNFMPFSRLREGSGDPTDLPDLLVCSEGVLLGTQSTGLHTLVGFSRTEFVFIHFEMGRGFVAMQNLRI